MIHPVLLVGLGGALGSILRYLVGLGAHHWLGAGFPWGTVLVNLLGSFLISIVHQLGASAVISQDTRLFLSTGVMGGFTTYSTFNYDTLLALELGAWSTAALNIGVTLLGCLAGGGLGLWVARSWLG